MGLVWGMAVVLVAAGLLMYAAVAGSVWPAVAAVAVFLLGFLAWTVAARLKASAERGGYPHRPEIERRTAEGCLTTDGYAAAHPEEFLHWANGPDVAEERIDRADWEAWNRAYFALPGRKEEHQ